MSDETKYFLPEDRLPRQWYNLAADFPVPMPPHRHPATFQPLTADDLSAIFPRTLCEQELTTERWIDIPEPVREIYRLWRPSPLVRARRLEKALDTPAKIYFKNESVSPAGSHKPTTAVAQAFYNKAEGTRRLTTETGAGQWGCSLAFAGEVFGLEVEVYMVKVSYEQKPYRRALMETYGATCIPSPSTLTESGRQILARNPDTSGSLGIAISEAVEMAVQRDDTHYALGSVLNHVCIHQSLIGLEAMAQMEMAGDEPDIVIGCAGGGSNLAGIAAPYVREKINGRNVRIIGVEPASCPTLSKGRYAYDFGDTAQLTPLLMMKTLGATFIPPGSHSGGLRYHGMAPMVSHMHDLGYLEVQAYPQTACFEAAVQFARAEGILPAPESSHAIRAAINEALRCKEEGTEKTILFNLSGHGHLDMSAYMDFFSGKMSDPEFDTAQLAQALSDLPEVGV
ncbi:TrpB-like pyridoxal phosphate-dependent enzyme [Phaeovibrio sulfidiphilus]|uniref:Tryptophan synthase beta chain n=1 Tax=Phaeovibrio sulfidiphilus TaxID=1220600 RepID=A0A8J6YH42_9PROT|nr:TrpB-like pyridoxal phosphate-dependent enzyme [Phaeovibrio sulfidiphilus]MBE1236186.1 TrpB-like pyridoxal phosphate-dependent enzyme [Phaeovibrio sulfidiphilus]